MSYRCLRWWLWLLRDSRQYTLIYDITGQHMYDWVGLGDYDVCSMINLICYFRKFFSNGAVLLIDVSLFLILPLLWKTHLNPFIITCVIDAINIYFVQVEFFIICSSIADYLLLIYCQADSNKFIVHSLHLNLFSFPNNDTNFHLYARSKPKLLLFSKINDFKLSYKYILSKNYWPKDYLQKAIQIINKNCL